MPRQLIGGTGGGAGSGGGSREEEILAVIDKGAEAFVFPMLDNGYVYLAGARLSLHRSAEDWALVFEIFGFSPRSEAPDVGVFSFGSRLKHGHTRADFVDESAYQRFLAVHPHDASEFFFPLDGDWQEDDDLEWVSSILFGDESTAATDRLARGHAVMGVFQNGKGTIFNAGSANWCYGLGTDATIERITRNVVERLGVRD